jgi:acyl-CoA oxidase
MVGETTARETALPAADRGIGIGKSLHHELVRLVFDGAYELVHQDIRALLLDPLFDARENLRASEAGRLAYQRARFVHGRLERPLEVLRNPARLFALAEWPSLLDVSTFSLLMVHYNLCLGTVAEHGGDRPDLAEYVEDLDSLTCFGPYMATELGYGNNVAALRTEAVYDPADRTFVLHTPDALAQKVMSYSGFADIPKVAVVMARLKVAGDDYGVFPFVVRISDSSGLRPGVHAAPCPDKPVQGLDNGVTRFDHMRIPQGNLLAGDMAGFTDDGVFRTVGGNRRKQFLRSMSRIQPGRICVASAAVSAGRAAVYIALCYSQRRLTNAPGRNDMPVIEYRSHQLPLFTALAKVYALTFLVNHVKREYQRRLESSAGLGSLIALIALTKVLSTWEVADLVATCRERCGAQGMFSVNRIADYVSLVQGLVTAEGDNQVLLATVAGQTVASSGTAGEEEPPSAGPSRDLKSPGVLLGLLRHRERYLLRSTREAMADESLDRTYFSAWNANSGAAMDAARTSAVCAALDCFSAALDDAGDSREMLGLLASLYGLTEIQAHSGWYLARGLLTPEQTEELPVMIGSLCPEILPHVPALIEAFNLSAELLRAPIAADDYVAEFERITWARPAEPADHSDGQR